MNYPRLFVAAYASRGTIWRQVGPKAWDAATITRVTQIHERAQSASYELTFADKTTAQVKLNMPPAVVAHRLADPTYDEIDSWSDDMMKLFPYVASDGWTSGDADVQAAVRRVLPLWESGIKHGP